MTKAFQQMLSLGLIPTEVFRQKYTTQFAYGLYVKACGWSRDLSTVISAQEFIAEVVARDALASEAHWQNPTIDESEPKEARLAFLTSRSILCDKGVALRSAIFLDLAAAFLLTSRERQRATFFSLNSPQPHWFGVSISDDGASVDYWDLAADPSEFMATFHVQNALDAAQ